MSGVEDGVRVHRGEGVMRDREPTIRSRELCEGLRRAMEGAELNGKQAARVLGWSESRVSRSAGLR
ncbi:MAG: hypothetical protein ACRDQZ_05675 [Mycobacteriales bacterium]